jgi:RES domain-containing protein
MIAWRLCASREPGPAFDGDGARLYGGRWNAKGTRVVYASEHLSLAALEVLVHLQPGQLRRAYQAFRVELPDDAVEVLPEAELPRSWFAEPFPRSTAALGSAWARSARSLALVVPSVIVRAERNVILNPEHARFKELVISKPFAFAFDPRLVRARA